MTEMTAIERVHEVIRKANEYNAAHGITDGMGRMVVPPANPSGIHPQGHRLVVKPKVVEEKTESGIVLARTAVDAEQLAQTDGIVVAIGEGCWEDKSSAWARVGDWVMFGKYKGLLRKGKDGVDYRIINDTDVVAVLDQDK